MQDDGRIVPQPGRNQADRPIFSAGWIVTPRTQPHVRTIVTEGLCFAPAWRSATLLVQPSATVLRWHRAEFRVFWRRRSRPGRRPPTCNAGLIRQMTASNPRWGAERIRGELLKLGVRVAKRTVQKYMGRSKPCRVGQPPSRCVLADMLRRRRCNEEVSSLRRRGHRIGHTGLRRKTLPCCGARGRPEFCNPRTTPARGRVGQGVRLS
jgi:hypothetical protein